MIDLMRRLLEAHGGLDRWMACRSLEAEVETGGVLWDSNGQGALVGRCDVRADLRAQRIGLLGLDGGALDAEVTATRIRLREAGDGAERQVPRPTGTLGGAGGRWDVSEAAFFHGYAIWTYMTQPFLWTWPGFTVEEAAPWREDGEDWRQLAITFPETIARHSRTQVAYVGPDGLLRRFDYAVDLLGGARGAH